MGGKGWVLGGRAHWKFCSQHMKEFFSKFDDEYPSYLLGNKCFLKFQSSDNGCHNFSQKSVEHIFVTKFYYFLGTT